jgi:hypothetical protein
VYSPAGLLPLRSHVTSCTPTKSNLYQENSLKTIVRYPALYRLFTFRVANLMSIFCPLGCLSKEYV